MSGIGDSIQQALAANPDLANTPGLALGVSQSADPYGTAQLAGVAANADAVHQARKAHGDDHGFLSSLGHVLSSGIHGIESIPGVHGLETVGTDVLHEMSKPLHEVQHQYRYVRSVFDRHGFWAGLGVTIPAGLAGVGTAILTRNPHLAILASEGVLEVEGQALFHEDWKNTKSTYTDSHGNTVSFGRDLAHLADYVSGGHVKNEEGHLDAFDILSGIGDAAFDFTADPLANAGRVAKTSDLRGLRIAGQQVRVGRLVRPTDSADDIYRIAQARPSVGRMFDQLSEMSAGDIATHLPKLAPLAKDLGAARGRDEVAGVFASHATSAVYSTAAQGLPKSSITRAGLARVNAAVYDKVTTADGGLTGAGKAYNSVQSYAPFVIDPRTARLSAKSFDPMNDLAINPVSRLLRFSQNPKTVARIMDNYVNADLPGRVAIYKNGVVDMLRAAGLPDSHPILRELQNHLEVVGSGGKNDIYALDRMGRSTPSKLTLPDGKTINAGLFVNQQGELLFPNFQAIRNEIRASKGFLWRNVGGLDQWVAEHYISRIFKPLALATLGFAQRVAGAEIVTAALDFGAKGVMSGALGSAAKRLAPDDYHSVVTERLAHLDDEAKSLVEAGSRPALHEAEALQSKVTHADTQALADRLGHRLSPGETEHVHAALAMNLWDAAWGKPILQAGKAAIGKGILRLPSAILDKDYLDMAHALSITRGSILNDAVSTGEHGILLSEGPVEKMSGNLYRVGASVPPKYKVGDGFTTYRTSEAKHPIMWSAAIKEAANDPGAQMQAKALLQHGGEGHAADAAALDIHDRFLADVDNLPDDMKGLARVKYNDPEFSAKKLEAIKALAYGEDGTLNRHILEDIAAGRQTPVEVLNDIAIEARPAQVKGARLDPVPPPKLFDRIINGAFKKFIDPTINTLSREPIYVAAVTREYKYLKPAIENGTLPLDDALRIAETRAVQNMIPLIHNTKLRSQFSDVFRNVMPFYFAQEQALRRYGNVAIRNPKAYARLALLHSAMTQNNLHRTNADGSTYVVTPWNSVATGWLVGGMSSLGLPVDGAIPTAFSGNTASLKTVLPEGQLPSLSPVVSVPLKAIEAAFPEASPIIHPIVGDIAESQSIWSQIIPNPLIKNVAAAVGGETHSTAYTSALNYAVANAAREGKLYDGQDPVERQTEIERLRNTTRIFFIAKALLGVASPLALKMDVGGKVFRDDLQAEITAAGDARVGIQNFLRKNPDATPDTVFQSQSATGVSLPRPTTAALDFVANNADFVRHHGLAASFLLPQDTNSYDPAAYKAEMAMGLRMRKSPADFMKSVYVAQGAEQFYRNRDVFTVARDEAVASGDKARVAGLEANWKFWQDSFLAMHPVFADDLKSGTRQVTARSALDQLGRVFTAGSAPAGEQTDLVRELYNSYGTYSTVYRIASANGRRDETTRLKDSWSAWLDQRIKDEPRLEQIIRSVFQRLPNPVVNPNDAASF